MMRQKTSKGGIAWRLLITLILAVCLIAISSSPVFALDFEDYLTLDYDIELSKTDVSGSGVFYAIVEGTWTCKRNIPVRITDGYVTYRVIAEHQESGTVVTLNSGYTINVDPFPDREGESTPFNAFVLLGFPAESEYGTYDVELRIIEGKINTEKFGRIPVTSSLPSLEVIDTVTYASAASAAPVAPVNEADEVVVEEAPAFFTASNLFITPTKVDMGEEVTINVLVSNTGDLSGSYEVILNIDGAAVATEEVTLAGGAGERVTFTTAQDIAGRYSVTIDGLSGTFDVKVVLTKLLMLNWQIIAIIAGATAAVAVPLAIRRRRRA